MTKREVWIDIAKGLAILLVIMGHSSAQAMYRDAVPIASLIYNCIYAFHMPLFFFLSGLVYKRKNKFASELKKKIEKLLVPSLVFSTPFILSQVMRDIRSGSNILTACLGQVKHIFLGQGHYWFITFLFIIQITAFFLGDNAKRNVVVGVLTGIYSILFISLEINPYILRIPFYAFYFLLGQLIGPNNLIATLKKNMVQKMVIGISLFVICLYLEMRTSNNYIAGVFTLFLGGMGTYIICIVSCIIECKLPGISNKLSAIGKMTLPIYLMDKYFVALFSKAIDAIGLINPLSIVMSCFVFETIILGGITHYVFRKNKILRIISGC